MCIVLRSLLLTLFAFTSARAAEDPSIDPGPYRDDAAVQATWKPMKGTAPAALAPSPEQAAIRLPCNFAGTTFERASWDRTAAIDLSSARGVQFEVFCADPGPIAQFSFFLQSDTGWYSASFYPTGNAWSLITIDKTAMRTEGRPAGWHRITGVRISAWRGEDRNTEFLLRNLRRVGVLGIDTDIALVRADSLARTTPAEARNVDQYVQAVADGFASFGISTATINDTTLSPADLRATKLIVLPYNPSLGENAVAALREYMDGGGKVLAFYTLPAPLAAAARVKLGRLLKSSDSKRQFAAIQTRAGALRGAPALVKQHSWNVRECSAETGEVLAEWMDDTGKATGVPAVIASANCVMMTHVLLADDRPNQRRLLLAMAARLEPELWTKAVESTLAQAGRIGGSRTFAEATALTERIDGDARRATDSLAAAKAAEERARALLKSDNPAAALEQASVAGAKLLSAYCLAQKPAPGEFRAFWCHNAAGVAGMDWDEAIHRLADAGFTAILPNMLWGGSAYYASKVLPVAADVAVRGDQLAQCLAAAKRYGVQVHVWKVDWNTGNRAPAAFLEQMRREGRLQVNSKGQEEPWLCPSNPANQQLEIAAMVEVARNYDVDGIHFDYIRYPDADHCFCAGCRERFARATGADVKRWPADVLEPGALRTQWLEWRRTNITAVVRTVSEQARAVKPALKISAAVFRNWVRDRDGVGQDWKLWCDRGWLDFVCPMDYTESDGQFEAWVKLQKDWAGRVPVYPGIGVSSSHSRLPVDRVIGQIEIARRHGLHGFTLFNYGEVEARELLPMLHLGETATK